MKFSTCPDCLLNTHIPLLEFCLVTADFFALYMIWIVLKSTKYFSLMSAVSLYLVFFTIFMALF